MSAQSKSSELHFKLGQVRALIRQASADAALIGRLPNFSWLSCGGEAHIPMTTDRSFGRLLVTPRKLFVLADRIEMPRLQAEALAGIKAEPLLYEWHDEQGPINALKKVVNPSRVISDTGDWGTRARPGLFPPLRFSLHPAEVRRYRMLGQAAEAAMDLTCRAIQPGLTEFMIAGHLAEECWHLNLTPVVLLVAADNRIRKFRHPLPTTTKLKRHLMLVLCARRHGLIVAMTRLVHFGRPSKDLIRRHEAVCAVDAALIRGTQVGRPVCGIVQKGLREYARQNHPLEWQLHHQGGPCGYEGRDYLGSATCDGIVQENQPFAWNPSITGTKSEDTILATRKGPAIITESKDWPMVRVEAEDGVVLRPDILVR